MSSRPCNYCEYQVVKRKAERDQRKVTSKTGMYGEDCILLDAEGTSIFLDGKFAVWYMLLPERCEC